MAKKEKPGTLPLYNLEEAEKDAQTKARPKNRSPSGLGYRPVSVLAGLHGTLRGRDILC